MRKLEKRIRCGLAYSLLLWLALAGLAHADPQLPSIPATSLNVTNFGAVGDSATDNGPAIQNTINAAASMGGGTVMVSAVGILTNYLSGPIGMSNNVCLEIDAGTKLQMLPMSSWLNPGTNFINGSKLHDVAITGSGIIDGQGTNWWFPLASPRPILINLSSCTNVLIQNVTLQNPPSFHIQVKGGDVNVTIQGITINTPFDSHNTDGIDVGVTNAVIRNCTINTGDDNIAFGSGATGVTISNCAFGVGHGLSIGSSTSGGANNILVNNCTWNGTEYGVHLKSARGTGGLVQDLTYRDLTMTNVNFVVAIYSYYNQIGSPSHVINETPLGVSTNGVVVTNNIPTWRNITISNVTASTRGGIGNIAGIIWGLNDVLVSNVVLSHVNFTDATNTFCIYNARDIQIIDCNLATPANTNTLTLYNADVTVTNSVANANLVTVGGLAIPPTNSTLTFFNARAAITDTNELGAGPITLGGSTLAFNQSSVTFSNNITAASASAFALAGGTNLYTGTFSGPLALNQPTGTLLLYGSDTLPAGGAASTVANLTVGDCGQSIAGSVTLTGGSLYVTNGSQTGVLDVRDGTVTLSSGLLKVDNFVMTNSCGRLLRYAGTLSAITTNLDPNLSAVGDGIPNGWKQQYGLDPFDPNLANEDPDGDGFSNLQEYQAGTNPNDPGSTPLRITAIAQETNNIRVTWSTFAGTTDALQRTTGDASGNYSTNNFADIFSVTNATGSVTNYPDPGAATNKPSLYYRVRLMP
jgi:polygalacturonase